ncbi:MAG: tetratricopeptide repeat protein [Candidatus Latescibacter sp.]|nr:tetratricopeptide repeat protein [Candidatus Latescibacter sp.]
MLHSGKNLYSAALIGSALWAVLILFGCAATVPKGTAKGINEQLTRKSVDLFVEGKSAEIRKDYGKALAFYFEALQYDPRNDDIMLALARVFASSGKIKSAEYFAEMTVQVKPANADGWRMLQTLYQQEGDIPSAAEALEMYIKLKPETSFSDVVRLSRYYFAMKMKNRAKSILLARIKRPNTPDGELNDVAGLLAMNGMTDDALSVLRRMVERTPANADAWVGMSDIYNQLDQDQKAIDILDQGLAKNPGNQHLLLSIGNTYMFKLHNWESAITYFEKARAAGFSNPNILKTLSALYFNARKDKEALALRDSIITRGEDDASFYFSLGKSMNYLDLYSEAADYYRKGFDKPLDKIADEYKLKAYAGYARALIRLDKKDEAVRLIQEDAVKNIKATEQVKTLEGRIYLELRRYDDAIAIFEFLSGSDPDNTLYFGLLTQAYNSAGKYDISEAKLLERLKSDPDNTGYLMQLGIVYDAQKNFPKAENALRLVIKKEPDNALALNNLAYMYMENGKNLSRALEMAKKATSLDPRNGAFLDTLGWGFYRKRNYHEARKYIEQALKYSDNQDKGVIYDHYGDVLARLEMKNDADDAYKSAIKYGEDKARIQPKIDSMGR